MASPKTRRTGTAKKSSAPKKRLVKKPAARKKPSLKAAKKPAPRRKKSSGFGRVRVPVDARLDLVFQKDYQAREIFDFLKVQSIRELEQFAPDEILDRLTGPMQQTVLRIRKTLALLNRHLARDEKFAKEFLREVLPGSAKPRGSQK
ncbi:MAG TPA: hypothetical protein VGP76_23860 [Planctomycetaceae bacterium]|jgi:hypothetical protein|nr:hypothetical protein [Planctomycetaceae bacterium]